MSLATQARNAATAWAGDAHPEMILTSYSEMPVG
jgi:hypothetical protein